ncbi:MAG: SIP domain-containing protein [Acidimicrobiales bacterium]|nr:SIP domain-containing protein [Acidimicrobiales bacterium]
MSSTPEPTFDAAVADQIEALLDQVNASHADTVRFVARHVAQGNGFEAAIADAELTGADPGGVALTVVTDAGPTPLRLTFDDPASSPADVQAGLLAVLGAARAAAGSDEPLTSLEREYAAAASLPTRLGRIERRRALTANVVEVTIAGLDGFTFGGGDEFSFVLVTNDGSELPADWTMADFRMRADDHPIMGAYYTTRRLRPDRGELDLWIVLHEHAAGVASQLERAPLGTRVAVWGPRHGFEPPAGARSVLFVADETGAAAVAALIETLPPSITVTAVLETVDADHELPLPAHPSATVRWVHRGDEPAGGPANRLLDAVRELCGTAGGGAGGSPAVVVPDAAFGAAESRHISAVRRYVRRELGLPADAVLMTGYWRREHP